MLNTTRFIYLPTMKIKLIKVNVKQIEIEKEKIFYIKRYKLKFHLNVLKILVQLVMTDVSFIIYSYLQ